MVADLIVGDLQELRGPRVLLGVRLGVVVVDPVRGRGAVPQRVQLLRRRAHAGAVAAGLADEPDLLEAAGLEALAGADEQLDEAIFGQRDRAGLGHVAADVFPAALGHVGHDRRDQRLAHPARDLVGAPFHDELVLAIDHVRALLLGARGADDHVGRAGRDQIADLGPGQIFDEDRVGRLAGRRRRRRIGRTLRRNRHRDGRAETNRCKQYALLHAPHDIGTLRQEPATFFGVRKQCSRFLFADGSFSVKMAVMLRAPCSSLRSRSPRCASSRSAEAGIAADAAAGGIASGIAAPSQRQQWLDMFARGYFPGRSGQVFVVPKQGWFVTSRDPLYNFMHGSPWEYDVHIPMLFYGAPFVKGGSFTAPAKQQDVAPTVGALIGASPLPTYTGRVLTEAIAPGNARPRVVTVFVLDAMRADYFDKYASVMPTLTRMRKEGAWFSEARHRGAADGHRRRPRQHRHRQRAALPRHRRQHPLQPRHRQVAGSLRPARYATS